MADLPIGGERVYLTGNFVVRASGDNRAVLRPKGMEDSMRIMAEFPNSTQAPAEGSDLVRSADRAFEVKTITRDDDGKMINIYVREITRE